MSGTVGDQDERRWRVRQRQRLVDSRWLRVDLEDVELPDGHRIDGYYVVHQPDWSIILAVTTDEQAILVRQYKHGIGRVTLELPAGYLEPDDHSAGEAIRRELREETGYEAAEIRPVLTFVTDPTRSPQRGHVFLATGCRLAGDQRLDPAERIAVVLAPLADLPHLIHAGSIEIESSIAAIYLGLAALRAAS